MKRDTEALIGQFDLQVDSVAFLTGNDANLIIADVPPDSLDPRLNFLFADAKAISPAADTKGGRRASKPASFPERAVVSVSN